MTTPSPVSPQPTGTTGRAPVAAALLRLAAILAPGSRVAGVRRLAGGIVALTHAFDVIGRDGVRRRLVLRRYRADVLARWPEAPERLWRTLAILERIGAPAPRPVWFDAQGTVLGMPAIVMTRLPGHGDLRPHDLVRYCTDLGTALAAIHRAGAAARLTATERAFLTPRQADAPAERLAAAAARCPNGDAALTLFRGHAAAFARAPRTLVHGDYWPGNILWQRGRLSAVIDWEDAAYDWAPLDVGYCRLDLALSFGGDAPDRFLRAYEQAAGTAIAVLPLWDLTGALRAWPDPRVWLPGYVSLGRTDLTAGLLLQRLRDFTADAVRRGERLPRASVSYLTR